MEGSEVHTVPPKSKLQNPNSKIQNQNSKIQNQNSKIQTPKIKTPRSKPPKSKLQDPNPQNQNSKIKTYINCWFMTGPPQKNDKYFLANHQQNEQNIKMEITQKNIWQLICSLQIHETGKMNEKKCARVSPRPIGPKKTLKNMILQAMYFILPLWLFFLLFYHLFFCFFILWGWTNSSRDWQGLISRPPKKITSKFISTASKISK